jgi:single-stranded-DNA-specific exonuclease
VGSVTRFRWIEPSADRVPPAVDGLGLVGRVLYGRGHRTTGDIERFLRHDISDLPDPGTLPDISLAISRIQRAIRDGDRIAIFGDYDVDGVTSTALLLQVLQSMGAAVRAYLPHRERDGYGLNLEIVRRIAGDRCRLLISVDCGSANQIEIDEARALGMETIVVDHHHVSRPLSTDVAFISPRRLDSAHAFDQFAAVGVSYQLARALVGDQALERFLPMVAVGTVADVVPLVGANRALVHHGLTGFAELAQPGLLALAREAGVEPGELTSHQIAFMIGPRLNAPGRIAAPEPALEILLETDEARCASLARELGKYNARRQRLLNDIVAEAEAALERNGALDDPVLVVHGRGWHIGVVGLVASRLSERFSRPAIVFDEGDRFSRGSARSIEEFNVVEALEACRDLLTRFGGHSMAAGMTIPNEHIPEFRERMNRAFQREVGPEPPPRAITLDAIVDVGEISLDSCSRLAVLEPVGSGNPAPCLLLRDAAVDRVRRSRDGKHLLFNVLAPYRRPLGAVSFGAGDRVGQLGRLRRADLAFSMRPNTWNGRTSVSLEVADFREASPIRL